MKVLDLLTYRGTLIVLNGVILLGILLFLLGAFAQSGSVPRAWLLVLAPALGLLAFATRRRYKGLLIAAIVSNILLVLVSLPFMYFAVAEGAPFGMFSLLAVVVFVVPVLTAAACWLRLPRAAAI